MTRTATHIYGIWFVPSRDNDQDWMARLYVDEGKWVLDYRFRYYSEESTDPHDGQDEKNWYTATGPDDSEESRNQVLGAMAKLLPAVEEHLGEKHDFVLLDCKPSDPKVFFELGSKPWAHVRIATKEEAEQILGKNNG